MKLSDFTVELLLKKYLLRQGVSRLPSERELSVELKISRVTVRKALDTLTQMELIFQYPGGRTRFINTKAVQEKFANEKPGGGNDSLMAMLNTATIQPDFENCTRIDFKAMDLAFPSDTITNHWNNCMSRFSKAHPGLKINVTPYLPNTEQNREERSHFDVLQCVAADALSYIYHKTTQLLDGYLDFEKEFSEQRFDPLLWQDCVSHGSTACIPYGTSVVCLAGLREDWRHVKVPLQWSWSEFLEAADYLATKTGKNIGKISNMFFLLNSFGIIPYFYSNASKPHPVDEKLLRRALQMGSFETSSNPILDLGENRNLIAYAFNTTIPSLKSNPDFVCLPFPREENGSIGRHTVAMYLAKDTLYPIESCKFIAEAVSLKNQRELARLKHFIPTVKKAQEMFFDQDFIHCPAEMLRESLRHSNQSPIVQEIGGILAGQRMMWDDFKEYANGKISLETLYFRLSRRIEALTQSRYPAIAEKIRNRGMNHSWN